MFNVIIIGGGNIGYRHFQGLLKTNLSLSIYVVDPNRDALNRIKNCYKHSKSNGKSCTLLESIEYVPSNIDLCIIATNSKVRLEVTEKLLQTVLVRYLILEKVLFQKENDYERMSALIDKYKVKGCWVNCPLRTLPIFIELKERINNNNLIYHVEYKDFGIGCNSIHQLDLLSFLTNCLEIKIDISKLESVTESKRNGYLEVLGTLIAFTSKNDKLVICSNEQSSPIYILKLSFNNEIWTIYPLSKKIVIEDTIKNEAKEKPIIYPKQSTLTSILADDLLLNGSCSLPDYKTSKELHLVLIKNLNKFFSKALNYEVVECPIT